MRGKLIKTIALSAAALLLCALTGCAKNGAQSITVISREDGSGTRGAFVELTGVESKNEAGEKVDNTLPSAEITNSTAVMLTSVADDPAAIGYISLGAPHEAVKALRVDGAEATAENIKNGSYKLARPFNIAVSESTPLIADFIAYIGSAEGQSIVEDNGYISQGNSGAYAGGGLGGKLTIGGSSSVTPLMEKLKEGYVVHNPGVTIEVQQSDSTTGMNAVSEGVCDIGMASRDLKDSELASGITPTVIAMDGIAVIVNAENAVEEVTSEQIRDIYTGVITSWGELA